MLISTPFGRYTVGLEQGLSEFYPGGIGVGMSRAVGALSPGRSPGNSCAQSPGRTAMKRRADERDLPGEITHETTADLRPIKRQLLDEVQARTGSSFCCSPSAFYTNCMSIDVLCEKSGSRR